MRSRVSVCAVALGAAIAEVGPSALALLMAGRRSGEHGYRDGHCRCRRRRHQRAVGALVAQDRAGSGRSVRDRGRKKTIPQEKIDEIVDLHELPSEGRNPLELRTIGRGLRGVEIDCAAGVVGAVRLKPHRVETFKCPTDPTLRGSDAWSMVVGLYLNPPEKAIVLCADEKSSVQCARPHPGIAADASRGAVRR